MVSSLDGGIVLLVGQGTATHARIANEHRAWIPAMLATTLLSIMVGVTFLGKRDCHALSHTADADRDRRGPTVNDLTTRPRAARAMRVLGLAIAIVEVAWALGVVIGASDGALSISDLIAYADGGIAFAVLGFAWTAGMAVRALRGTISTRHVARVATFHIAVLVLVFVSVHFDLAFKLRFAASRAQLQAYSLEVAAGTRTPTPPEWVGLFRVYEVDHPADSVRFITGSCFFDDCGFAYSPRREPPRVGEDSYRSIGPGWYSWWRSW